jgi:hypothetical protein
MVKIDDIEIVGHSVAIGVQENNFLRNKRHAEFIQPSADSAPIGIAQMFSSGRKARVAS